MPSQIVTLTSQPNQTLTASISINGGVQTFQLTLRYGRNTGFWAMDVADRTGRPIISSVPLITGAWPAANILSPYQHLGIGSAYVINTGTGDDIPGPNNLGTAFLLLWDDNVA